MRLDINVHEKYNSISKKNISLEEKIDLFESLENITNVMPDTKLIESLAVKNLSDALSFSVKEYLSRYKLDFLKYKSEVQREYSGMLMKGELWKFIDAVKFTKIKPLVSEREIQKGYAKIMKDVALVHQVIDMKRFLGVIPDVSLEDINRNYLWYIERDHLDDAKKMHGLFSKEPLLNYKSFLRISNKYIEESKYEGIAKLEKLKELMTLSKRKLPKYLVQKTLKEYLNEGDVLSFEFFSEITNSKLENSLMKKYVIKKIHEKDFFLANKMAKIEGSEVKFTNEEAQRFYEQLIKENNLRYLKNIKALTGINIKKEFLKKTFKRYETEENYKAISYLMSCS